MADAEACMGGNLWTTVGGGDFVKCKLNDPIISLIISLNSKFSCIYSYFPVPVHMFRITMRHLMSLGQTHDDGYL